MKLKRNALIAVVLLVVITTTSVVFIQFTGFSLPRPPPITNYDNLPSAPSLNIIGSPDTDGRIELSWRESNDVWSYYIYRRGSDNVERLVNIISHYYISFTDTVPDGTYTYKIGAKNNIGMVYSNTRTVIVDLPEPDPEPTIPDAPVLKSIEPRPSTDGNIRLEWDIVSDADRYAIYRSNDDASYDLLGTVNVNYYDDILANGVYYYKLKAGNIDEKYSDYSNTKSITVQIPGVPDKPEAYSITYEIVDSGVKIYVTWSSVSCNTYNLYRKIVNDTTDTGFVLIREGLTSTSYSEVLTEVGKYTYKVSAVNTLGESDQSNPTIINMTDEGVEKPEDYMWLYVLLGVLGVAVVPVVLLTRKRKRRK